MLPRRFFVLSAVAAFAVLSTLLFLHSGDVVLSTSTSPINISPDFKDKVADTWDQAFALDKNGKEKGDSWGLESEESDVLNEAVMDEVPGSGYIVTTTTGVNGIATTATATAQASAVKSASPFPPPDAPLPDRINVAIVESGGTNDETTAGLIHAFGKQSNSHLSLYTLQQRYGVGDIINSFKLAHPLAANKSSADFGDGILRGEVPDVIVSATCETDLIALDIPLTQLLELKKTYLFCIVHQPERWASSDLTRRIQPWIDEQLVDLVTLSQHTAHFLRTEIINDWDFNATITVRHMTPLFPVSLPDTEFPTTRETAIGPSPVLQYPIAIHGDFDASRHNYTDAFTHILALKDRAKAVSITTENNEKAIQQRDVSLHVFGERIPPDVPKNVKPILNINREMSYQRQYEILSQSYILLPAFASDSQSDYMTKLASWAIPASLIAGVPIVSSDDILFSYSYLPKEAVWLRYWGENEMKVAERVALWSVEEHRKKKEVVRGVCKGIIERNEVWAGEWVGIAVGKVGRHSWRFPFKIDEGETVGQVMTPAWLDED